MSSQSQMNPKDFKFPREMHLNRRKYDRIKLAFARNDLLRRNIALLKLEDHGRLDKLLDFLRSNWENAGQIIATRARGIDEPVDGNPSRIPQVAPDNVTSDSMLTAMARMLKITAKGLALAHAPGFEGDEESAQTKRDGEFIPVACHMVVQAFYESEHQDDEDYRGTKAFAAALLGDSLPNEDESSSASPEENEPADADLDEDMETEPVEETYEERLRTMLNNAQAQNRDLVAGREEFQKRVEQDAKLKIEKAEHDAKQKVSEAEGKQFEAVWEWCKLKAASEQLRSLVLDNKAQNQETLRLNLEKGAALAQLQSARNFIDTWTGLQKLTQK